MAEIGALTPSYAGVTYDRLNAGEQLHWPVRDASHPGTPVLHVGKFPRGLGRFVPSEHLPARRAAGRRVSADADHRPRDLPLARRGDDAAARGLNAVYPEALIEVSPKDAQAAGVKDGDLITLASRRGEIVAKAQVTPRVGAGLVFATFHFPDSAVNFLTNPALDPQAKIPEFKVCAVKLGKVVAGVDIN